MSCSVAYTCTSKSASIQVPGISHRKQRGPSVHVAGSDISREKGHWVERTCPSPSEGWACKSKELGLEDKCEKNPTGEWNRNLGLPRKTASVLGLLLSTYSERTNTGQGEITDCQTVFQQLVELEEEVMELEEKFPGGDQPDIIWGLTIIWYIAKLVFGVVGYGFGSCFFAADKCPILTWRTGMSSVTEFSFLQSCHLHSMGHPHHFVHVHPATCLAISQSAVH